jgi:hypothetical protein
MEPPKSRKGA